MSSTIAIAEESISVDEIVGRLVDPSIGAVVTFVGVVRGVTGGRETVRLEYEAYHDMALVTLQQIADEVRARWHDVRNIAIVHRVGSLAVGETAIVIALSVAHRAQAFDALHYAIDRVKEIAPIWKKEIWADGSEWRSEH